MLNGKSLITTFVQHIRLAAQSVNAQGDYIVPTDAYFDSFEHSPLAAEVRETLGTLNCTHTRLAGMQAPYSRMGNYLFEEWRA